ncbi:VanZ family protein [Xylophilus sp. GOD-11R]|uniref:VanZ family protein n=1 Tax=Xylophilus sp. GOD-11R TaxID=3089814 RepID=UPI00298D0485|nr:VanZ family protein [Xylophilus sp. GOD-11R]WPB56801.1 VanZ family protein [Xylophilus sp. GOD-11R]
MEPLDPARPRPTAAGPLALAYMALIVYASLYPFGEWRDQGIVPWAFLWAPLPRWWTGFDVTANVFGYGPLGFLLALAALRSGRGVRGIVMLTLCAVLLSLILEALQSYLPVRVPSNVDLALNSAGAVLGAALAYVLERLGGVAHWARLRERWFIDDSRGALVLLALWPMALLFPVAVPFGLGQVLERLEDSVAELLEGTPFVDWLPVRAAELLPLAPGTQLLCVALGVLVPCLVGYSIARHGRLRVGMALGALVVGSMVTGLSSALSYGPVHAWEWLTLPVRVGLALGMLLAALTLRLPRRACAALALVVVVLHLNLLNEASTSAYFWQTLQTWEQGRFIRFHGLVQWLGWLWPFGALAYLLLRVSRRERVAPRASA